MARGIYERERKYGDETQRCILVLAGEGKSAHAISAIMGISPPRLWKIFAELGLATNRDPVPAGACWDLLTRGTVLEGVEYPREAA